MSEARVCAEIQFRMRDPDATGDPAEGLSDALNLVIRLGCERLDFLALVSSETIDVQLDVMFGPDGEGKADLLRLSLVRAEGEAGYEAIFTPGLAAPGDWMRAAPYLDNPALPTGEPFSLPIPIETKLGNLLRRLEVSDSGHGYRLTAWRRAGQRDVGRKLIPALARCRTSGGPAARLIQALESALNLICEDGWHVEEALCLPKDASDQVAELAEAELVGGACDLYPFLPPERVAVAWDDLRAAGGPPAPEAHCEWQVLIGAGRASAYPGRAVITALEAMRRRKPPPIQPSNPLRAPEGRPRPAPTRPFAFLSYAHADRDQLEPVFRDLAATGLSFWFDDQIHAGEAWDEYLENHIRQCALMIAFVSPPYERSRYCRREIKFADLLQKPILPVALQAYSWGPGLAFMFQELQLMRTTQADAAAAAAAHAARLAPATMVGAA